MILMTPKYKNVKFENITKFRNWLLSTTKHIVEFEDGGQDFCTWYIAGNNEVVHSDMQSSIWNGLFILSCTVGEQPELFINGSYSKLNYKVAKITTLGGDSPPEVLERYFKNV